MSKVGNNFLDGAVDLLEVESEESPGLYDNQDYREFDSLNEMRSLSSIKDVQ